MGKVDKDHTINPDDLLRTLMRQWLTHLQNQPGGYSLFAETEAWEEKKSQGASKGNFS